MRGPPLAAPCPPRLIRFTKDQQPLGADAMIAFGPEEDHRCAQLVGPEDDIESTDSRQFRSAGDGAATGHSTAAGLARMYAALACGGELDGVRLLRAETIEAAVQEQALVHADPAKRLGFGYVMNQLFSGGRTDLIAAIYRSLGAMDTADQL